MTHDTDQFDPQRLRLTAYALGELDEVERAAIEAELEQDADSRAFVEQMRSAASALADDLSSEPTPEPLTELRTAIDGRIAQRLRLQRSRLKKRPLVWVPWIVFLVALVVLGIAAIALYFITQWSG